MEKKQYKPVNDVIFFLVHLLLSICGYVISWSEEITPVIRLASLACFVMVAAYLYFALKRRVRVYRWFVNITLPLFIILYILDRTMNGSPLVYELLIRVFMLVLPYFGSAALFYFNGLTQFWMSCVYFGIIALISLFGGRKKDEGNAGIALKDLLFILAYAALFATVNGGWFRGQEFILGILCLLFAAMYVFVILKDGKNPPKIFRTLLMILLPLCIISTVMFMTCGKITQNTTVIMLVQNIYLLLHSLAVVFFQPFQLVKTTTDIPAVLYMAAILLVSILSVKKTQKK